MPSTMLPSLPGEKKKDPTSEVSVVLVSRFFYTRGRLMEGHINYRPPDADSFTSGDCVQPWGGDL